MKLRKWLAMVLAVVMAIGTFGALVGCKPEEKPKDPSNPSTPSTPSDDDDDTAIQYYLCGLGLGTLEASNNWDNTSTDESLKFTRTGNTATITADLYEGDEFGIIHNQAWDGQMGMNIVANGGKATDETVIFEEGGGYDVKNIKVAAGQSGKYKLTLTLNSESDFGTNSLTWELVEKYDVVFVTWIDVDGETELGKTVVKKNTAATSRIYDVSKRFYEFDKWVTELENKTAFDFTKNLTESVSLYATIKESANASYVKDDSPWKIQPVGGDAIEFKPDPDYKQHNVFVATYEMADGAEFSITNGTIENAQITGLESSRLFKYTAEKYKTNTGAGGNYKFTIITEKTGTELKVSALYAEALKPTFTGYAIIGDFADASWGFVNGVSPVLTETGNDTNVFKATLVVTAEMIGQHDNGGKPQTTPNFRFKICHITKDVLSWDGCVGDSANNSKPNGNAETAVDDNYWITAAGTYTVTFDATTSTLTVTSAVDEYYVVGGFTTDWAYVEGTNPKLTETGAGTGIFTGTLTLAAATEVKVAVVANGAIQWNVKPDWGKPNAEGNCRGGANVALEAGTYTVTLNTNTDVLTFTPVTA